MAVELKVPNVGESITEVQVSAWVKGVGDPVATDDTVVELETDKVTVSLPAPTAGTIKEILVQEGETATVGTVLGYLEEGAAPTGTSAGAAKAQTPAAGAPPTPVETPVSAPGESTGAPAVMPAARRLLDQGNLSPSEVKATGPGGRLLKEDVLRHPKETPGEGPPPGATAQGETRREEVVPMTRLRQRVAERLVSSQQEAALLTTFNEIDMSPVMALRRRHQESFKARHGIKLGIMSFFVKGVIEGLKQIPQLNAEIRGTDIVYKSYFDIGIAVGGGKGLVVPIIRNADRLSFAEVEKAIAEYGARARNNALTLPELQGGTFTISNGGIYGSMLSTPIINPPQTGILGLHNIQDRPVAVDGEVVIRPMMYVALTYDHRIVDGREAVTFLVRIKECLEDPARILLEV